MLLKQHLYLLTFLPFTVFAGQSFYENPLGSGDTSILNLSSFIKAVFAIVMKVGIPVATMFIIWSGFLFLTAQGDETQLKKAKSSFVWACIGTAVLLGSWLLATAVQKTVGSIGGSGVQSVTTTADSGHEGDKKETKISPALAILIDVTRETRAGASSKTDSTDFDKCSPSENSKKYVPTDVMEDNDLDPNDPELFNKSVKILHNDALKKTNEQAYLFVRFGGGGGSLLHTASGDAISTEITPTRSIEKYILNATLDPVKSINILHTHPVSFFNGKVPPSLPDLQNASIMSKNPETNYIYNVADSGGFWEYSVPRESQFAIKNNILIDNYQKIASLPKAKEDIDLCRTEVEIANTLIRKSLRGSYGAEAKDLAKEIMENLDIGAEFYEQDVQFLNTTDFSKKKAVLEAREQLEKDVGIILKYTPIE